MRQLNAYCFYELGAKLREIFSFGDQPRVADLFTPMTEAQALLDGFIKGTVYAPDICKDCATKLLAKIGESFDRYFVDPSTKRMRAPTGEERIDTYEMSAIRSLLERFEQALAAELNRAPTYIADKRGIYSTHDLAENAEQIFPFNLRNIIPASAQKEVNTAGRALVFGFGTAATVHILRSIEIMLKLYYESFVGAPAPKGERNFAMYVKKLTAMAEDEDKADRPDARTIQLLAQIKGHYRNPLIAPDATISADEAMQLFGMASAAVAMMADQVKTRREATGKTAATLTPDAEDEDDAATAEPRLKAG